MSRGRKETAQDLVNEDAVARRISADGMFMLRRLYQYAWADFAICKPGEPKEIYAFAEVRCKNAFLATKYARGVPFGHEKFMRCFELKKWTHRPLYLFFKFWDGVWWTEISQCRTREIDLMPSDRGTRGGAEVVVRIPTEALRPIDEWQLCALTPWELAPDGVCKPSLIAWRERCDAR